MSAFREQLRRDIDNIFLNTDEFADTWVINGKEMVVIEDSHTLAELKTKSQYVDAVYDAQLLIFVKPEDLEGKPAVGARMNINGRFYVVMEVSGEGLYRLMLKKVE